MALGSFLGHAGQGGHEADPCPEKRAQSERKQHKNTEVGALSWEPKGRNSPIPNIHAAGTARLQL